MYRIRHALHCLAVLILLTLIGGAAAQAPETARLRIIQLSYIPEVSATVDVQIDDAVVFEDIGWPFATDYLELPAGTHTLTTTIVDDPSASASAVLELEAGHDYSVVVDGKYTEAVNFTLLDYTALLPDVSEGSNAVVVNLTDEAITDIAIDGELVLDTIAGRAHAVISLPDVEATLSGRVGESEYSEVVTPFSYTDFLITVVPNDSGVPQLVYHRSSRLTVAEYLGSIGEGAEFSQVAALIGTTDLLSALTDDGEYTLFLPTNEAVDEVVPADLPTDPAVLRELLADHAVAQHLPPFVLPLNDRLTTLSGATATLRFMDTESGFWEIEGSPILWDVRLENGIIYGIYGLVSPSG